jgi:hypothetical protein
MAVAITLVHLGAGLELLAFGLGAIPRAIVAQLSTRYPRLNSKLAFRVLLIAHCRRHPGA